MTYRVVVTSGANADLVGALDWYAERAPEQMGRLVDELERVIDRVRDRPAAFPELQRGARRASLKVFPYQVWYRVDEDRKLIEVLALVHGRQDRAGFTDRLR